jgi:glycosyltransferase involved in cell wall biosynthesis
MSKPSNSDRSILNVLIVNQYATIPRMGGVTRHHGLAKHMVSHGVRSLVIAGTTSLRRSGAGRNSPRPGPTKECVEGVSYVWLPTRQYASNGVQRIFSMSLFAVDVVRYGSRLSSADPDRPDIVLGSSPHLFAALAAYIVSRRLGVPFVLEVRDLWPKSLTHLLGLSGNHPLVLLLGAIERYLYRRSDVIIGVLQGVRAHVRREAPGAAGVHWIPNGVETQGLPATRLPPASNDFRIVYTGAHGPPNALQLAVLAAQILQDVETRKGGRYRFLFVGDGVEKQELTALTARLALDNVSFLDRVPKNEVFGILSSGDALLITAQKTNLYDDGMSLNKLFDYFAAGRPVLMGLETPYDPVHENRAGICFSAGDANALVAAVLALDSTTDLERSSMGQRGRDFALKHHSYASLAGQLSEVLTTALADYSTRSDCCSDARSPRARSNLDDEA